MPEIWKKQVKNFNILSFGEVMLRLSPTGRERIGQSELFEKRAGGSELNVVSGISLLGLRSGLITKLPDNAIGKFIKNRVRDCGVSDDFILYDNTEDARLGIYYYESGVHPRKPCVVYDRKNSSMTTIHIDEIPSSIYDSTNFFHTSGISIALCKEVRDVAIEMMKRFKDAGAVISFDVNYRANLWSEEQAKSILTEILPLVDILFVSEETSRRTFGKAGELRDIMKSYAEEFGVSVVATTERTAISPTKHNFTSTIYSSSEDQFYSEAPYTDIEVIDRIGSGDAYVSGVLFGLLKFNDYQKALEFGNAMSAVKNTVPGDLPSSDYAEIKKIIESHKSTGFQSEMDR